MKVGSDINAGRKMTRGAVVGLIRRGRVGTLLCSRGPQPAFCAQEKDSATPAASSVLSQSSPGLDLDCMFCLLGNGPLTHHDIGRDDLVHYGR